MQKARWHAADRSLRQDALGSVMQFERRGPSSQTNAAASQHPYHHELTIMLLHSRGGPRIETVAQFTASRKLCSPC